VQPTTVLIVDDNKRLAEVLRSLIDEEPDFSVVPVASTAAAAVQRLVHDPVDVVIVDDRLADGDGMGVVRRLRKVRPEIRVLLWSSAPSEINLDLPGVDGYLAKGETFQLFIRQLRDAVRALGRQHADTAGPRRARA
jgi:DNA-binding NarL/FixJ family response regulator